MRQRQYMKILRSFYNTLLPSSLIRTFITPIHHTQNPKNSPFISKFSSSFSSSENHIIRPKIPTSDDKDSDNDNDSDNAEDEDYVGFKQSSNLDDKTLTKDVKHIVGILREHCKNPAEVKIKLEECGIVKTVSSDLVVNVLSQVRNEWEAAFTFFLWAGKQPGYAHSVREYHAMISILGKMRKFDTAWSVIDEMRRRNAGDTDGSTVTFQTLLIMIRKYCAVHDVGRAISTFYAYKRFKLDVGVEEFQGLLSALCRYKNVQDAEQLLFCNRNVYPWNVKSFNIILNGWCNIIVSPREAERFWMEMGRREIKHDVVSYGCIISCYLKSCSLYKVLRFFDQMKKLKIEPDRKVYNAVIHALAKGRFVNEAFDLKKTMEEKGIASNVVTYNSLIKPLCKAWKMDEARQVFDEMLQRKFSPTVQTYHAFFRALRTKEEVFELLEKMRKMGCDPSNDTYIMLTRKFCRWRELDGVFKLWDDMISNGISPDRSSYIVLIHGLFLNGKCDIAYKYYTEMQEKGLLPEPKIDGILRAWKSGKDMAESQMLSQGDFSGYDQSDNEMVPKKAPRERNHLQEPETRRLVRERGFSFWDK